MKTLDHPLKRLSFIFLIASAIGLLALGLLPSPVRTESYIDWRDTNQTASYDRVVKRVDTTCAGKMFGNLSEFAKEYLIADALVSTSEYPRFIAQDTLRAGGNFSIAPLIDITTDETARLLRLLNRPQGACLEGTCTSKLNPQLLLSILQNCGKPVTQLRHFNHVQHLAISDNLKRASPWPLILVVLTIFFALTSILYNRALKPLVSWVRKGSSKT